eukprot:Sdes_comp14282_c0_seq2m3451
MELDFEKVYEENPSLQSSKFPEYYPVFTTLHKSHCRVACFSRDGKLAATGSSDASIKLMDVTLMQQKMDTSDTETRPVLRTLYDHNCAINTLDFHPFSNISKGILAVGSRDCAVK